MTDEAIESESDDEGAGVARRFSELRKRVVELVAENAESQSWFAMWGPVLGAVVGLGKTLAKLAFRLRQIAVGDSTAEPIDDELQEELLDDVRSIRDDFPDVAELLFGVENIDRMIDAIASDVTARRAAVLLLEAVTSVVDRTVTGLIDVALGTSEASFGPERVVEFLERYEELAQRLLDHWLIPTLGGTKTENPDD